MEIKNVYRSHHSLQNEKLEDTMNAKYDSLSFLLVWFM
jgi:hypothetical protein